MPPKTPRGLCLLALLIVLLTARLGGAAPSNLSPAAAKLLCDSGFPSWGTLQTGTGPFNVTMDPPLEAGNSYVPSRAYRITLSTIDGSKFEAFHITPMEEKTGRVWPNATSVVPGAQRYICYIYKGALTVIARRTYIASRSTCARHRF